jgi:hypothetical protein
MNDNTKKTCARVFITALFTINQKLITQYPPTEKLIYYYSYNGIYKVKLFLKRTTIHSAT